MANVAVVIFVVVMVCLIVRTVRRHSDSLVGKRGLSIGADLGSLSDRPRVRVQEMTRSGPDRVHLILAPEAQSSDGGSPIPRSDLDLVVGLRPEDFGFDLLQQWQGSGSLIALVVPPGSKLVRLRSVDSLQHLTLRRLDPR